MVRRTAWTSGRHPRAAAARAPESYPPSSDPRAVSSDRLERRRLEPAAPRPRARPFPRTRRPGRETPAEVARPVPMTRPPKVALGGSPDVRFHDATASSARLANLRWFPPRARRRLRFELQPQPLVRSRGDFCPRRLRSATRPATAPYLPRGQVSIRPPCRSGGGKRGRLTDRPRRGTSPRRARPCGRATLLVVEAPSDLLGCDAPVTWSVVHASLEGAARQAAPRPRALSGPRRRPRRPGRPRPPRRALRTALGGRWP